MIERKIGETLTSVSVGTAISLEALMKIEKPLPEDFIFMNVRTIYRNFHNAIEAPEKISVKVLAEELEKEILNISMILGTRVPGNITPVFYICSNKSLRRIFSHAKLKEATTENQKNYESMERSVMEFLMETTVGKKIKIFDCLIKGSNSKALIFTHYPVELLSYPSFHTLKLIESNTGLIKDRSEWYTKLTNPESYLNLPFNALTIQIIGDNAHQFNSSGIKFIKPLKEIAEKGNWSTTTTNAKVKYDVEKYWDKLVANIYLEMLSSKLR